MNTYKKYQIEPWMADEADARAAKIPKLKGSIMGPLAKIQGCLGEILVEHLFKSMDDDVISELTKTTHDYSTSDGYTFEVKTKNRTVAPKPDFDCTIYKYNHDWQMPDFYVFTSLQRDRGDDTYKTSAIGYHTGYIVGFCTRAMFDEYGKHWKKGELDTTNNQRVRCDCINIHIKHLCPMDKLFATT